MPVSADYSHFDRFDSAHDEVLMGSLDEILEPEDDDVFGFAGLGFNEDGGDCPLVFISYIFQTLFFHNCLI